MEELVPKRGAINGVELAGMDHRIVIYTDDILLFVKNPESSIPITLSIRNELSKISGYKNILKKSEALPLVTFNQPALWIYLPWTSYSNHIYKQNFTNSIAGIKIDLNSLLKMSTLPRLLYPTHG